MHISLNISKNILMPPGFYCRDVVAVLISYNEGKAERCLVVCSAHFLCESKDPPPQRSWGKSCAIVKRNTRDGTVHQFVGAEPVLEVSGRNIKRKIKHWIDYQHMLMLVGSSQYP
jgi:hypothetical protein